MENVFCIAGGRIIDPANGRDEVGDVFVADGVVVKSLSPSQRRRARTLSARGLVVAPGLVDIHVHLREPGQTHKECIATGTRAAAAGGFTSVVCMPNTVPPADNTGTMQQIAEAIRRDAVVNVFPTGCITREMKGEQLTNIGSLKRAGAVAITDDGHCVQSNEMMRRALEYAHMFNLPVMDHCQDTSLTEGAVMHEGVWSLRLGLKGWPAAAEEIIVSRNAILAAGSGAHVHLQHLSAANSVAITRRAKARGTRLTAEVCPHHLALTDAHCATYDTNFKMNPPLRTDADRQALIEGLLDGTIDCLATDHAPHTDYEKDKEFDQAPFGIVGLETALSVAYETLVRPQICSLSQLLAFLTHKPSSILQLGKGTLSEGAEADICLFDPEASWTVTPSRLQSRSANSPWLGQTLPCVVRTTFVRGRIVWEDGHCVVNPRGDGN